MPAQGLLQEGNDSPKSEPVAKNEAVCQDLEATADTAVRPPIVKPNILMIAVDDLRPMLGCYGDPVALTPNIDRLAERGILFERAYCQFAKCGPSRLSILTGLRPDAIGVWSHRNEEAEKFRLRRPDAVSIPRWFKDHGWHAQGFGKVCHDGITTFCQTIKECRFTYVRPAHQGDNRNHFFLSPGARP